MPAFAHGGTRAETNWLTAQSQTAEMEAADVVDIDSFILATMSSYHIPSVSAAVVKEGRLIWSNGYGWADIGRGIPATDTTLYMLASVSKTLTGAALMQLSEDGRCDLDQSINNYLPFTIVNPNHPTATMTVRQVLAHTSSLNDNWTVMFSTYCDGDTPIPLDQYVRDYFLPAAITMTPERTLTTGCPKQDGITAIMDSCWRDISFRP